MKMQKYVVQQTVTEEDGETHYLQFAFMCDTDDVEFVTKQADWHWGKGEYGGFVIRKVAQKINLVHNTYIATTN